MMSINKSSFLKEVQHQHKDYAEETIIIGGDFNCTLTDIVKKGGNPFSRKIPVIQEIIKLCYICTCMS